MISVHLPVPFRAGIFSFAFVLFLDCPRCGSVLVFTSAMSFSQLGYPQYLSATQAAYGGDRTGVLSASFRGSPSEIGAGQSATAAVTSVLGMYANPYAAPGYSAFLPYSSADLALFSQLVRAFRYASVIEKLVFLQLSGEGMRAHIKM